MDSLIPHTFAVLTDLQVRNGVVVFLGLVLSLSLHEFGHAAAAVWLGDPTPKNSRRFLAGRIDGVGAALGLGRGRSNRYTINPLAHADPIGTVLLPLMAIFVMPQAFLFGWGRPVPFDPYATRRKISRQKMIILVSLAGPIANLLQALAWSAVYVALIGFNFHDSARFMVNEIPVWVATLIALNVLLACFNLLPIPPLDGGHILVYSIERTHRDWAEWLQRYGIFVFIVMLPLLPFLLRPVMVGSEAWILWLKSLATG